MDRRSFRYRVCDLQGLAVEELELAVAVGSGETVRLRDGRLMVVFAVVSVEDEPACDAVLMVEPPPAQYR